jgi:predicted RNase H-like HicB family nuclease
MQFPIAIHKDDGTSYGVTVPDVLGCHSFGDTIDEAIQNAKEAIDGHLETLLELGEKVDLHASSIEDLQNHADYKGVIWGLVDVDLSKIDATPERVNISLPKFVLSRIDSYVTAKHETRSGFLARAALSALAHEVA